jgi:hypothetical protein
LALLIFFGNSFPVAAKVEQAFESFENVHRESYTIEPLLRSYSEGYVLLISTTEDESGNVEKDYGWVSVAGVNNLKLTLHETTYTYCTLLSPQESGEQGFTIFAYLPTIGFVSTDVVTSYTRVSTSGKTPTVELGWGSLKGYLDDNLNNEKTFGVNFEYGIINSLGLVGYGQWGNIQNPVTTELTYEVMVQLYPGDPSVGFEYPTYRNVKNYPIWVYRP